MSNHCLNYKTKPCEIQIINAHIVLVCSSPSNTHFTPKHSRRSQHSLATCVLQTIPVNWRTSLGWPKVNWFRVRILCVLWVNLIAYHLHSNPAGSSNRTLCKWLEATHIFKYCSVNSCLFYGIVCVYFNSRYL